MKIIFFGTSKFALPALKMLAADPDYALAAIVTQPDKPAGRKQEPLPSPVKLAAEKLGLQVVQPVSLSSPPQAWGGTKGEVEVFIVASYGNIIPQSVLDIPKYGALNIHPSLLPQYRGPSPIQTAILNGDTETGVTIMKLDEEMDHGPILGNSKFQIPNSKIKYAELHDELAKIGAELLLDILPKYIAGEIKPVPQDHSQATFTKIITKEDGRIDWSKTAVEIDQQIRAYESWPVAWTTLEGKRLKIYEATPSPLSERVGPARYRLEPQAIAGGVRFGTLQIVSNGKLVVSCASGALEILSLQLEGAKKISGREFANGYRSLSGKCFSN